MTDGATNVRGVILSHALSAHSDHLMYTSPLELRIGTSNMCRIMALKSAQEKCYNYKYVL